MDQVTARARVQHASRTVSRRFHPAGIGLTPIRWALRRPKPSRNLQACTTSQRWWALYLREGPWTTARTSETTGTRAGGSCPGPKKNAQPARCGMACCAGAPGCCRLGFRCMRRASPSSAARIATTVSYTNSVPAISRGTTKGRPLSSKPGSTGESSQSEELELAQCMRSHGVANFPDPSPEGGFLTALSARASIRTRPATSGHCRPVEVQPRRRHDTGPERRRNGQGTRVV